MLPRIARAVMSQRKSSSLRLLRSLINNRTVLIQGEIIRRRRQNRGKIRHLIIGDRGGDRRLRSASNSRRYTRMNTRRRVTIPHMSRIALHTREPRIAQLTVSVRLSRRRWHNRSSIHRYMRVVASSRRYRTLTWRRTHLFFDYQVVVFVLVVLFRFHYSVLIVAVFRSVYTVRIVLFVAVVRVYCLFVIVVVVSVAV